MSEKKEIVDETLHYSSKYVPIRYPTGMSPEIETIMKAVHDIDLSLKKGKFYKNEIDYMVAIFTIFKGMAESMKPIPPKEK